MPRETSRRKNIRVATPLGPVNPVRIQEQRRFFNTRGNDSALRDAESIAKAFQVSVDFVGQSIDRKNVAGDERALEQAGGGLERDSADTNAAYHKRWDAITDERNLNLAIKEIPEMLRELDWENQPEDVVQAAISEYMAEQFKGIDTEQGDHRPFARSLLKLEATLIAEHRDIMIGQVKEEQRTTIFENAKVRFADTGEMPYEYIAEQTNIFFDGAEKREAYWEMIYDMAIEAGDPDAIRNVPDRFANGDPTGINDPVMADEHRAAIKAATAKQAAIAAANRQLNKEASEKRVMDLQIAIANKSFAGLDATEELNLLRDETEAQFSDWTSAVNFGQSQLAENESRSADVQYKSTLWQSIHGMQATLSDVMIAYSQGYLGSGEQAVATLQSMMSTVVQRRQNADRGNSESINVWRSAINKVYNANLDGPIPDKQIARINVQAHLRYNALVYGDNPVTAEEAYKTVRAEFDAMIEALPPADLDEISARLSQAEFEVKNVVTASNLRRVVDGTATFNVVFGNVSQRAMEEGIINSLNSKDLTDAEADLILDFANF